MANRNNYAGKKIRELRKSQWLTQEKLAEQMHCGRAAVIKLENGQRELSYQEIICLCRVLKCTPNELFPPEVSDELAQYYRLYDTLGKFSPRTLERLMKVFLPDEEG